MHTVALRSIVSSVAYKTFFGFFILLAAALEVTRLQQVRKDDVQTLKSIEHSQILFQIYFICDLVMKLIAHYPDYGAFFSDKWNFFDVVMVTASIPPLFLPLSSGDTLICRAH
jgi:hypothetical protein